MRQASATRFVWSVPAFGILALLAVAASMIEAGPLGVVGLNDESLALAVMGLAFGCVGALVTARQPGNAIGWLFCGVGLASALSGAASVYAALPVSGGEWGVWLATWSGMFIYFILPLVLLLFPDGKPLSRGWRLVVASAFLAMASLQLQNAFAPGRLEGSNVINPAGVEQLSLLRSSWLGWGSWIMWGLSTAAGAVSLVQRFRRSRGVQRQQLKWLALAASFLGVAVVLVVATAGNSEWAAVFLAVSILLLPLVVGVAITRYHLYDIDMIVNRTLVYGSVSAAMALIYVFGTVGVGDVLRDITGQQSNQLAVAASTLAVAALFRPLRNRTQDLIDRRFYRSKYNAARTVEVFSARLQEEVDLESLTAELVSVVRRTMQPATVSLWIRP